MREEFITGAVWASIALVLREEEGDAFLSETV
jgi:hypothetical protein